MKNETIDQRVFQLLEELKPVRSRDPHAATRGRTQFLTEAVSLREKQRHKGWIIFPFQEKRTMKFIVSTLVIVGLLFGGGATVSAAQDDLPNQALYRVKLISEAAQLWVTSDPIQQINLLMEQEQVRLQEMQMLAAEGVIPPADVAVRAQERIQRALQIAAQLDEDSQLAVLQQIRTRLQTQEQQMILLEQGTCTGCIPVLRQTREMLQLQLRKMEKDPTEPGALQNQNQNQNQLRINQTPVATGTAIPLYGTCTPAADCMGQQNGSGTAPAATPVQQQNHDGGGTQNGPGSGSGGGSQNGSDDGSSTGNGAQGGRP